MNIVLIGMPACGKSTIGVVLAKTLGYRFIDTDLIIQEREGETLEKLIAKFGLLSFLIKEEEAVGSVKTDQTVIATGGSVIYREKSMQHLKENGLVIYFSNSYEAIASRIRSITTRGVVIEQGKTLYDLYQERKPLYERYCDIKLETDGMNIEEVIDQILTCLKKTQHGEFSFLNQ